MNHDDSHGQPLLTITVDDAMLHSIRECIDVARAQMAPDLTDAERFAVELSIAAIAWHASRVALRGDGADP